MMTIFCRLGRDAERRVTTAGEPVATLALAYDYGKKGADGKRPTQWVEAALWGKRGEALAPYLTKGSAVVVSMDDVHVETYTTRDGRPGAKMVARVVDLTLAGKRDERDQHQQPPAAQHQQPPAQAYQQPPAQAYQQPPLYGGDGFGAFDGDDIPF